MKKYRVIITDEALEQARAHLRYIAEDRRLPLIAERWWEKALDLVSRLGTYPRRCPYAPENLLSRHELRMLVVDNCLFVFHVDEESDSVLVVRFRHGSQEPWPID